MHTPVESLKRFAAAASCSHSRRFARLSCGYAARRLFQTGSQIPPTAECNSAIQQITNLRYFEPMPPQKHKFCFGPWNLSEGQDPYGPTTRPAQTFDWKLAQLKKLGFDAMMFHDDDAVPDIDGKSAARIRSETKELKKKLADAGVAAEMVAPRLWFNLMTIDGAYTSNDPRCRQYAI